ncbi:uncharacterized protein [Solanum tuberosum]|uniref:uncharacterized protein isoform X1 n=1 Tax=Solanum tuberosum TaxID=4113 RepID=UPI00073A2121|nr:PREDICTED: uncharacterized protein LOC102591855 isoform X1 [Solanum tuberosum]
MAFPSSNPQIHLSMVNVANFVSIKLCGESNYIPWKTQIICLLQSHDLFGFVDGTIQFSLQTIAPGDDDEPEEEENEEKGEEMGNEEDKLQRKRNDGFVKGWIFGSLSDQLLQDKAVHKLDSAREVWLVLEQLYSPKSQDDSNIERAESIESKKDFSYYLQLYRASLSGDWKEAEEFLSREKEASRAQINSLLQTALHVAVGVKGKKGKHFVEKLVATIENDEDIAIQDSLGDTPLHYAARFGNLDAAKILVSRNSCLPHIACFGGLYPIHYAAEYGYVSVDVFAYFLSITKQSAPYIGRSGVRLLYRLIHSDLYDFARELVEDYPDLAKYDSEGKSALKELAMKEFTFLSGSHLNFWQQLVYYCVPVNSTSRSRQRRPNANDLENDSQMVKTKYVRIYFRTGEFLSSSFCFFNIQGISISFSTNVLKNLRKTKDQMNLSKTKNLISVRVLFISVIKKLHTLIFGVLEIVVPPLKHIRKKKLIHHNAVKYAECLCEKIETLNDKEVDSIVSRPLLDAACYDTYELVEIIFRKFPSLAYCYDQDSKNIFHIAIEHRCENVFNLICQMSQLRHQLMVSVDSSGNTVLHLAGKMAQNKLNLVSGPALQMQRELQWFKEVKKIVPPLYWESLNGEKNAPYVVFTDEHEKLKVDGEKWMKDTSSSCTIAAALIATIAFAAAITVPGGNEQQTGLPIFSGNIAFIIFAISNAASLFTSSTSLLVFLSVLTSRYAEEDFLHTLPRSLILGLLTLFLSITSMMISFSATVYLVFGEKKSWVLVPVATMACLPITSFVLLQFPLLVALISSTYGAGIFGKKSNLLF